MLTAVAVLTAVVGETMEAGVAVARSVAEAAVVGVEVVWVAAVAVAAGAATALLEVAVAVELTTAPSAMGVALTVLVGSRMVDVDMKMGGAAGSGIWLIASCSTVSTFGQPRRHEFRRGKPGTSGKGH